MRGFSMMKKSDFLTSTWLGKVFGRSPNNMKNTTSQGRGGGNEHPAIER